MRRFLKYMYAVLLTAAAGVYLVWRVKDTVPYDHGTVSVILGWILLAAEILGCIELLLFIWFYATAGRKQPEKAETGHPAVDVMVPTCGEPVELLRHTLTACLAMRWEGEVKVWLLDDADRSEMKALAEELGVGYYARKKRTNAKAGNLNAALRKTHAPLIAFFDADMAPHEDFLEKTVPYMGKGVGFVQTPQSFTNPDLFQSAFACGKGIPNEQDFFYRSIEPARNHIRAVVLAGSNMLISRQALVDVGGFVTGTLTEDFATGIEIQKKGYGCVALTETLAEGLSPESLGALIRQRKRWARGCIQSGRKTKLLTCKGLTFAQRMSYLMAVSYWYFPVKRLIYIAAPVLYSLFGIALMRCDLRSAVMYWLPMFVLTGIGIPLFSGRTRSVGWSMFYEICLTPFLFFPVLSETFGIRKTEFQVTEKSGRSDWKGSMLLAHLGISAVLAAALVRSVQMSLEGQTFLYAMLIAWNIYHLYLFVTGALFVCACKKERAVKAAWEPVHRIGKADPLLLKLPRLVISLFR